MLEVVKRYTDAEERVINLMDLHRISSSSRSSSRSRSTHSSSLARQKERRLNLDFKSINPKLGGLAQVQDDSVALVEEASRLNN